MTQPDHDNPTPWRRSGKDISVVLCTFDGARWLPEMLASLATQTRWPDEVIVQDDASTDDTASVLHSFAASAPFAVSIERNEVRLGSTRNFERALARSSGAIVALADQDDVWHADKLQRLTDLLDEDPIVTLVFSDATIVDEYGTRSDRSLWETRHVARYLRTHEVVPCSMFARRALSTGCTMAVRRRAVDAALPFPAALDHPTTPMRHDRWLSLIAAGVGTVQAVPEQLMSFRVHPSQQTGVLTTRALVVRLAGAVRAQLRGLDEGSASEHLVRARQLEEAAARSDQLGDFEEADALRHVAAHHRFRADSPTLRRARVCDIARELRRGEYDRSLLGLAGAGADIFRAVRPRAANPTAP